MGYEATQEQLIEDCQLFLRNDPRFWSEENGVFCWWGKVVEFVIVGDEITLDVDGDIITFLLT